MTYQQPHQPPPPPAPAAPGAVVHPGAYGASYSTTYVMQAPVPKGLSVTSMVLGIVSFFFGWTLLVPIAGLILGCIGIRKEPQAKGFSITGIILNSFMLLSWVVVVVFTVLSLGAALSIPFLVLMGTESV